MAKTKISIKWYRDGNVEPFQYKTGEAWVLGENDGGGLNLWFPFLETGDTVAVEGQLTERQLNRLGYYRRNSNG